MRPFVAIAFCPRISLTLVSLMSFSLRSARIPGVVVGLRLPSGGVVLILVWNLSTYIGHIREIKANAQQYSIF